MNNQQKQKLKKTLRRAQKLPMLKRLKPATDRVNRLEGIREEAELLKDCADPVVLFGVNRLSLQFFRQLRANGVEAHLIALDGETVPQEYADAGLQPEDLIYLRERQPRFYSMAASRDGMVKSRLLELGFQPQKVKRLGYGTLARVRGVRLANGMDPLLGSVRTKDSELPGYTVFRSRENAAALGESKEPEGGQPEPLRILVLGGSTSDPTLMNLRSWSEYLFHALQDMGIQTVIYNGAVGGYTSSQELKKLMRDIAVLRPQLVLSLSGVNDAAGIYCEPKHPLYQREDRPQAEWLVKKGKAINYLQPDISLTEVNLGPEDPRSLFQVWLDNERCMHAIATEFGAEFHAFLQPVREISAIKTDFYREAKTVFARKHPQWLHDLSRLFDRDKSVYADFCHVYEKGNRILCREMLRTVLEYISKAD